MVFVFSSKTGDVGCSDENIALLFHLMSLIIKIVIFYAVWSQAPDLQVEVGCADEKIAVPAASLCAPT